MKVGQHHTIFHTLQGKASFLMQDLQDFVQDLARIIFA